MKYCHKRTFDLRWTDLDFQDCLKVSRLLELAQEAAGTSAEELGFGYHDLKQKGLGFIIVATHCKFLKPIGHERCSVETWPLPPRHVFFERHYRVLNEKGEEAALLSSRWCLVDLNDFSLKTAPSLGEANEKCPYNPKRVVEVPNWKIPKLSGEGDAYSLLVGSSQCDHYLHANNTRYADFFLDCFTMQECARGMESFQISYGKQAKEGDELKIFRRDTERTSILSATREEETVTQAQIVWRSV